MQDRYVGDVGDFGKYGLLRYLTGQREAPSTSDMPTRLGVVWYLYPNEANGDGKFTGYLCKAHKDSANFRVCDPSLYDKLQRLVETDNRNILAVQQSGILPVKTLYYGKSLSFPQGMSRIDKQVKRTGWFDGALEATYNADVVFVDPDNSVVFDPVNGIPPSVDPLDNKGPKYVFIADLSRFYQRGQSLVIYHHLARWDTHIRQTVRVAEALKTGLDLPDLPRSLIYRRGTARAYFIVPQDRHRPTLESKVSDLLRSPWNSHFKLIV